MSLIAIEYWVSSQGRPLKRLNLPIVAWLGNAILMSVEPINGQMTSSLS
jgi:hypothetical protein